MTGFDKKVLHITHRAETSVDFHVEVDFVGTQEWASYGSYEVKPGGYVHHEFPAGFSAHWVRITPSRDCVTTAQFIYT
jgi:hypothetical protein